jgi:hypothetical protein
LRLNRQTPALLLLQEEAVFVCDDLVNIFYLHGSVLIMPAFSIQLSAINQTREREQFSLFVLLKADGYFTFAHARR